MVFNTTASTLTGHALVRAALLSGDFDSDWDVDGFDFLKWQRGLGDDYDATDLAAWEQNYGTFAPPLSAATAAVPEPTSLLLALSGLTLMRTRRSGR